MDPNVEADTGIQIREARAIGENVVDIAEPSAPASPSRTRSPLWRSVASLRVPRAQISPTGRKAMETTAAAA